LVTSGSTSGDNAEVHFTIEILDFGSITFLDWDIVPNLVADTFDLNHLLKTPHWEWQSNHESGQLAPNFDDCPSTEACTQQFPVSDTPGFRFPGVCHFNLISADGHLNWEVVTYTGTIHWDGHESAFYQDDDYNFKLRTPEINGVGAGATRHDQENIQLEFKASETIDHFGNVPYWKGFRDAVDNDDGNPNGVEENEAIAIGLLGLDRVHPPSGSELHALR
jgi:hypothetical protein